MPSTFRVFLDKMGGTDANNYIGRDGDLFYDPKTGLLRVSDGATVGGKAVVTNPSNEINGGTF